MAQSSEIGGVINKYVRVTAVSGISTVKVTSSSGFSPGDTVLIVQMKGAVYSSGDPNIIDSPGDVGKFELTVVGSVSGTDITFNSPLKNSYDVFENVQLIRVPSYREAIVTGELSCAAWDGEKGGVLAVIASNSLTLSAPVNVSGKGFRGGTPVTYTTGTCFGSKNIPFGTFNILNHSADSTSGMKGEGAITNHFPYTLGKGPSGNGGGAGTGSYSGGGGGGNRGIGGNGAKESCAGENDLNWGGNGGRIDPQYFSNSLPNRRIYLGGGGGSGIRKTSSSGTSGGNGGGIIILLTPYLITNNFSIKANGADVTGLVDDGSSSGGGGGGGMILIAVDSVRNNLFVSAAGGKGGGTAQTAICQGQGGGGGGGFVWFSGKSLSFASLDISGGETGGGSCDISSTDGNPGDSLNYLILPLTGFLNNTLNAVPKACHNTSVLIKGSHPQGGNGVYTYQWQYRNYGSTVWIPAPGRNDTMDYRTPLLTDTAQFRRIVSSEGMNDVSTAVTIDVFPQIINDIYAPDTLICYGSSPVNIAGTTGGGTGNFSYEWHSRSAGQPWKLSGNTAEYNALPDTTRFYLRKVSSGFCHASDSIKIVVLPAISNNLVSSGQTICSGSSPQLTGRDPAGGDGNFTFSWQQSTDTITWNNLPSTTRDVSNPPVLSWSSFYRRIVTSGPDQVCQDTSKIIRITVLPSLLNNVITDGQTICQGTRPAVFHGSSPSGGDPVNGYRYQWEMLQGSQSWDSLHYSAAIKDYQASAQDTTRSFRRIVYSGLNDCCKSISNVITVTVQPEIKNNIIYGDTSLCDNAVPARIRGTNAFTGGNGSGYTPWWIRKTLHGMWQDIPDENQFSYQPGALSDSAFYIRVVTSGACTDSSNIVKINVLDVITGNEISGDSAVCEGYPAGELGGGILSGGEPGNYRIQWERSTDKNGWELIEGQSSARLSPGILNRDTYFKRVVRSGPNDCCQSVSNILRLTIDKRPDLPEAGKDKEILYQDTTTLLAIKPASGSGRWSTMSDAEIDDPDHSHTKVSGLKFGRYVFYWTVSNGVCPSAHDSMIVTVNDLQRYTGFSPNGDGINDVFTIGGLEHTPQKNLTIMNRWGVEVFHSPDYQNDWNGKNKNGEDLPEDTYYYILTIKDIYYNGKQKVYKGYFVIRR